ncbi:NADP-dependent oxidoreductase [Leptospira sp. 96542]|nr:NADP-dependent oxidoreductase [Leptospira sp. 96542]
MKAQIVHQYGKKTQLKLIELPEPEVQKDEVLVKIAAAGVNLLDSKLRNGDFKLLLPYKLPFVLGHDVAGTVIKIGSNIKRFKIGDEIYARPADHRIGTFAELIAIKEEDLAIKPKSFTMEEAASIPLVGLTAWQALVEIGKVNKGQKVFIQAGSGGVGTFAIQLAKYLGATVATTTSAKNIEFVKSLGADIVVDYNKDDFENKISNFDVVLNSQDGKTLNKSLNVLKPGGKLISISGPPDLAFAEDIKASWFIKLVMQLLSFQITQKAKKLKIDYSFLFMKANGNQLSEITSLIDSGKIRPVIDKVFPFDATNEAMAYVENGRAKGKIVVKVSQ